MKRIISTTLFSIYLLIVITMTIYVLNINKYNISQIGSYSFLINDNNSLLILNKKQNININDEVYYYDTYGKYIDIRKSKIIKKEIINEKETLYTLENNNLLSNKYLIGNINGINIPILGKVIDVLSSTLGYLVFIVLPILFILIYFTYNLKMEIKNSKWKKEKN